MGQVEGKGRLPYWPAIDGLRALAVIAVLLFHAGFGWARGGYLGVTVFFTLSGFLITALLLRERDVEGRIDLRAFWRRRARRLVPAVLVLFVVVAAYAGVALQHPPRSLVGDAVSAATWVANWRFILSGQSYQAAVATPSPLQHMWSLSIEEQFYLFLPLLAVATLGPRRSRKGRVHFSVVVAAGIVASSVVCWLLASGAAGTSRAYYGTDARAAEPLIGVALALLLVDPAGVRQLGRRAGHVTTVAALASLAGLAGLMTRLGDHDRRLYHGGLLLTAVLTAVVVVAAVDARTLIARALAAPPLVALGRVSYGIYLFHWPIFLWLNARRTGLAPAPLFALRCAVTLGIAAASYVVIERPVRKGVVPGRLAVAGWAAASTGLVATIAAVVGVAGPSAFTLAAAGGATVLSPAPPVPTVPVGTAPTTVAPPAGSAPATTGAPPPHVSRTAPAAHPSPRPAAPSTPTERPSSGSRSLPGEAVVVPATAPAAPSTTMPVPMARPPVRIAVIGDSMADSLGRALTAWSKGRSDVVVYDLAIGACSLSRGTMRVTVTGDWANPGGCYWWSDPGSDRAKNLSAFSPDVIFVQDAMNESPDWRLPMASGPSHIGQPAFDDWLWSEYRTLSAVVAGTHGVVVFGNAACWDTGAEQWASLEFTDALQRVDALNVLYQRLAAAGERVLDLDHRLCPSGTFTETVEGIADARPDGYHLSDPAALAVANNWLGPQLLNAVGH